MANKIISNRLAALAAMVLLCCGTILNSGIVLGQSVSCVDACPVPTDDANNVGGTAGVPWTGGDIDTTIFGCPVEICYACRTSNLGSGATNHDYVVTQICVDSSCFASSTGCRRQHWNSSQRTPACFHAPLAHITDKPTGRRIM